jgi:hypothetical protein
MSTSATATAGPQPSEGAGPSSRDRLLLRTFEPVLRFTDGELFLPTSVDGYVARCSLWAGGHRQGAAPLVPAGAMTLDRLSDLGERFRDRPLYLRLVQQPLSRSQVRAWWRDTRPRLHSTARLAAVGVIARLVDLGLRLSLLVRGRVPRGLVAAAERITTADAAPDAHPYYGRVVEDGGYTVLQYWYFYAFNDWRSTFHGVNDHEADWELVTVYLAGTGDRARPAWVAGSSHDHEGAVLRRRWDDPALQREGDHPVVHPGAGSHSGAFVAGDYVVTVEVPALRRLLDALRRLRPGRAPGEPGFAIPFVDYARGDGVVIGPGHRRGWRPELIDDRTPWVAAYRGLWGLDTRDPFGGERAPAGPRYDRGGSVRRPWADPLGWAGLATVAPTADDERAQLRSRLDQITARVAFLDGAMADSRTALRGLRAQARSLSANADTRGLLQERSAALRTGEAELTAMTAERTRLLEERSAHSAFLSRPAEQGLPDAHLHQLSLPSTVRDHNPLLRVWAAVSTPLLLLWIGVLLTHPTALTLSGFSAFLVFFAGVEALARGRIRLFLTVLALALAWLGTAAGLVLALLRNWQLGVGAVLAGTALVLIAVNLRELFGRPGTRLHRAEPPDGTPAG